MINLLPGDDPVAKAIEIRDWIQSQPWYDLAHVPAEEESLIKVYISNIPIHMHLHIYSLHQRRQSLRNLLKNCNLPQKNFKIILATPLP
jgi:hypothetical protein